MEGRKVGLTSYEKGQRETMKRLLEIRFGPLDEKTAARVHSLSSEKLSELEKLFVEGKSLNEMDLEGEEQEE